MDENLADEKTMEEFERMFQTITQIVLGKKLTGLVDYEKWLTKYVEKPTCIKSAVSNEKVYVDVAYFYGLVKRNFVRLEESLELGKRHISLDETDKLGLANAAEVLKDIRYATPEARDGENTAVIESGECSAAHYAFRCGLINQSKYVAYCLWPRQSEYVLGSSYAFSCKFCINCYNSVSLTRCFEVSDSNSCSDCYFCHNCENLSNCMFCFNIKSKRYAIGNVEIGREKYMELRKRILEEIVGKLEREKKLDIGIYNIGCWNKK